MHRLEKMKDKLIGEAVGRMENLDGGSIEQMSKILDMIKDLCEAERACLEAEYYEGVVECMGEGRYGYREEHPVGRMGYKNQYGDNWPANPKNRRRRSGYSDGEVEALRSELESADPERRRQMKRDLEDMLREM